MSEVESTSTMGGRVEGVRVRCTAWDAVNRGELAGVRVTVQTADEEESERLLQAVMGLVVHGGEGDRVRELSMQLGWEGSEIGDGGHMLYEARGEISVLGTERLLRRWDRLGRLVAVMGRER